MFATVSKTSQGFMQAIAQKGSRANADSLIQRSIPSYP